VEEITRVQSHVRVSGKHLHLPVQTMEQLGNFFVLMARNWRPDGAFREQSDEGAVAVTLVAENGVELISGDHALALASSEDEGHHALRSGAQFLREAGGLGAGGMDEFCIDSAIQPGPIDGRIVFRVDGAGSLSAERAVGLGRVSPEGPAEELAVVVEKLLTVGRARRDIDVVAGSEQEQFTAELKGGGAVRDE